MADLNACRDIRYTARPAIPGGTETVIVIPALLEPAGEHTLRQTAAYVDARERLARIANDAGQPLFVWVEHPRCSACEPIGYTVRPTKEP